MGDFLFVCLFDIPDKSEQFLGYSPQSATMYYNAVLALVAMIADDRSIVYFNKLVFFQTELQSEK